MLKKKLLYRVRIEETQTSLSDFLQVEKKDIKKRKDTEEVVNYVRALNMGISLLDTLPISFRYIKELHKELLKGVRGESKNPGEVRRSQNWIGPAGGTLTNATYVPPSVDKMDDCIYDLENYMNSTIEVPFLIKIALIHYQFETIHPFLDGNGRLGRLLIPLWLKESKVLNYPLIYLSLYFKENRQEYYSLLMDVRFKGRYEEWIKFFLIGVTLMSKQSIKTIGELSKTRDDCINLINRGASHAKGNQLCSY
jgi:Fic family protein